MGTTLVSKLWSANNEGAKLMVKGQYQRAFLLLRSAINQAAAVDPSKMVREDITHDAFVGIGMIPLSAPKIVSGQGDCDIHHDVFPLPFAIHPQSKIKVGDYSAGLLAGTAVALFNMALSRHRLFFLCNNPKARRHLLSDACILYQTIYQMLGRLPLNPDDPIAQVYLMTCCNMIHICNEYGALDLASYWKNELTEGFACVSREFPGGTFQFLQRISAYCTVTTVSAGAA